MKHARSLLAITVMAILFALVAPATSFGKDRRGRWRDQGNRDNWDWSRRDRKCGKFVNCHDARDGRWDGRGRRRQWTNNTLGRDRLRYRLSQHNFRNGNLFERRSQFRDFDDRRARRIHFDRRYRRYDN